jgi:AraC-like DNA-binding protein
MDGMEAWERAEILFESYTYGPGPRAFVPVHTHEHYQWCLSLDFPGLYHYRGARYAVPEQAVSVIHPFEPHAVADPYHRDRPSTFLLANIPVPVIQGVAVELVGGRRGRRAAAPTPFFGEVVSLDPGVRSGFLTLWEASLADTDRLALDTALLGFLHRTLATMEPTAVAASVRTGPERRAVAAARDHLHANAARPVALAALADVAGLSQRQLFRAFKATTGVSPHRYQLQLRVDHAKRRIARGEPLAQVAAATGFVDQSHMNRQFKRYVGVPPGRYRRRPTAAVAEIPT